MGLSTRNLNSYSVGLSVIISLKGREVLLWCFYWSTCFWACSINCLKPVYWIDGDAGKPGVLNLPDSFDGNIPSDVSKDYHARSVQPVTLCSENIIYFRCKHVNNLV